VGKEGFLAQKKGKAIGPQSDDAECVNFKVCRNEKKRLGGGNPREGKDLLGEVRQGWQRD